MVGKIDLDAMNQRTRPPKKSKQQKEEERKAKIAARKKGPSAEKSAEMRMFQLKVKFQKI